MKKSISIFWKPNWNSSSSSACSSIAKGAWAASRTLAKADFLVQLKTPVAKRTAALYASGRKTGFFHFCEELHRQPFRGSPQGHAGKGRTRHLAYKNAARLLQHHRPGR